MEQIHRDLLRTNHRKLKNAVAPQIQDVVEYLWSTKIITEDMKDNIMVKSLPKEQANELLRILPTRGPDAFRALYDATKETELHDAADILMPDQGPHRHDYVAQKLKSTTLQDDSEDEPLPEKWPLSIKEHEQTVIVKTYENSSSKDKYIEQYKNHTSINSKIYHMSRKTRGPCLILSNEKFETFMHRDGTEKDVRSLDSLFQGLGFDVDIRRNLKREELWLALVKEISKLKTRTDVDCFVLIILTHGDNGVIYGTDGYLETSGPQNYIKVAEIKNLVDSVDTLKGKPKLLFIQACRGKKEDADKSEESTVSTMSSASQASVCGGSQSSDIAQEQGSLSTDHNVQNSPIVISEDSPGDDVPDGVDRPRFTDIFIANSTTPDSVSWRNDVIGTWFIQAVAYIFSRYAYKHDIQELMTKVNDLVSKTNKQVSEVQHCLTKKLYFFPHLSNKDKDN